MCLARRPFGFCTTISKLHTTDADRQSLSHMLIVAGPPDGSPAKALWRLDEAVEVMADMYCGTLSLECASLQQDEITWMQQRFENRRPLTGSQKRQVRRPGCRRMLHQAGCLWITACVP